MRFSRLHKQVSCFTDSHGTFLKIFITALTALVLITLFYHEREAISASVSLITLQAIIALTLVQLLSAIFRVEAWGICLQSATKTNLKRSEVHAVSAPLFISGSFLPVYLGTLLRIILLRRKATERKQSVPIGHALLVEGLLGITQLIMLVVSLSVIAMPIGLSWQFTALTATIGVIIMTAGYLIYSKFQHYTIEIAEDAVGSKPQATRVGVLLFVSLLLQPVRYWIVLHAIGINAGVGEAVLVFTLASVLAALPIGQSAAGIGATAAVIGSAGAGASATIGLALSATGLFAACIYSIFTLYVFLPERLRNTVSQRMSSVWRASAFAGQQQRQ